MYIISANRELLFAGILFGHPDSCAGITTRVAWRWL